MTIALVAEYVHLTKTSKLNLIVMGNIKLKELKLLNFMTLKIEYAHFLIMPLMKMKFLELDSMKILMKVSL